MSDLIIPRATRCLWRPRPQRTSWGPSALMQQPIIDHRAIEPPQAGTRLSNGVLVFIHVNQVQLDGMIWLQSCQYTERRDPRNTSAGSSVHFLPPGNYRLSGLAEQACMCTLFTTTLSQRPSRICGPEGTPWFPSTKKVRGCLSSRVCQVYPECPREKAAFALERRWHLGQSPP